HVVDNYSLHQYFDLLRLAGLDRADAQGGLLIRISNPSSIDFYDENTVKSADPETSLESTYTWRGIQFAIKAPTKLRQWDDTQYKVRFYPNGIPVLLGLKESQAFSVPYGNLTFKVHTNDSVSEYGSSLLEFYESGDIKAIDQSVNVDIGSSVSGRC